MRFDLESFLCPNCLRFSKYRLACGACWLEVEDNLVRANHPCPRCRQPLQENVRAWCQRCWCGSAHTAYHQRPVRVLATLQPSDFTSLCRDMGVQQMQAKGSHGYAFDNGTWLAYVLNLSDLTEAKVLNTDAFQEIESIWVDAAGEDTEALSLALIEAADHFIRQAGLNRAQQRALTICVRQDALEPVVEHVLATRFSAIRYGVEAADFLCDGVQAEVRDLGEIKHNPTIHTHIAGLKSGNADAREAATMALRSIGDKSAVPALIAALRDSNDSSGRARGISQWVPALVAALKDSNDWGRYLVAMALEKIGDQSAVPALIDALKDSDADVRGAAAEALRKIGDESAVPALIDACKDSEAHVRVAVMQALMKISGRSAVPALIDALKDSKIYVRQVAARALGNIGDRSAMPALIDALKDRTAHVRWIAAEALGEIGDRSATPALIAALKDGDHSVREHAAMALRKIGDKSAAPALIAALKGSDGWMRYYVAEALAKIGDESAVPALIDSLKVDYDPIWGNDGYEMVRGATKTLEGIGKPAVPALISALKGSNRGVGYYVARALGNIGDESAVPALIDAHKTADWYMHNAVVEALVKLGHESVVPALEEEFDYNGYEVGAE